MCLNCTITSQKSIKNYELNDSHRSDSVVIILKILNFKFIPEIFIIIFTICYGIPVKEEDKSFHCGKENEMVNNEILIFFLTPFSR